MEQNNHNQGDEQSPLQMWLKRKKETVQGQDSLKIPAGTTIPLSFGQERLLFLHELFPESSAYHFTESLIWSGHLDVLGLEDCFNKVVKRHHVLHARFYHDEGRPVIGFAESSNLKIAFSDLTALAENTRMHEAKSRAVDFANQPFDLKNDLPIRCVIYKLSEAKYFLVVNFHHIVCDAWSMPVFWNEMAAFYAGNQVPDLNYQYGDFSFWQRNQTIQESNLAYWKNELKDAEPLEFPKDFQRPMLQSFSGAQAKKTLSRELTAQLKQLGQKYGTTLFTVLTAACNILLWRYTGQANFVLGTPMTKRTHKEWENLVGFFVNTILLKSSISESDPFPDYLRKLQASNLKAIEHSDIHFEKLVEELNPKRSLDRNPLFQIMLIYQEFKEHPFSMQDVEVKPVMLDTGVSKFDLSIFLSDNNGSLDLMLEYDIHLFKRERMERMLGHLETLLSEIVSNPTARLNSYPILTEPEKEFILEEVNQTDTEAPAFQCIHHWIGEVIKNMPDQTAVVTKDDSISYFDLNQRAEQLALRLISEGAQANMPVGLCAEPSVDLIVGILGILKAGAAYLPIDPEYPSARIEYMLEDAAAIMVVCQSHLNSILPESKLKVIDFNDVDSLNPGSGKMETPGTADSLAYLIYTSGSTGKPKGVKVNHQNLIYSTFARLSFYQDQPGNFLLLSSFSFDSSIVGIFWTLCSGGTLVLPEKRIEQDMDDLGNYFTDHQISHTLMLPSLYQSLLDHVDQEKLNSTTCLIVAGEACPSSLVRKHFKHNRGARLYNEYGPTEATVWATACEILPEDMNTVVPIGKPIPNMQIYVLDSHLNPVPVGVPGELYLGGKGISTGYHNNPELTSERFVSNPFNKKDKSKLYKTGDLVQFRESGVLEFLGRVDQQVKIRGYRIELEEIREVILANNLANDAIVMVHEENHFDESQSTNDDWLIGQLEQIGPDAAELILKEIETLSGKQVDHFTQI